MYQWGSLKLKINPESYSPPHAVKQRSVIGVIHGADLSAPASVLQDGGRERYQTSMSGFTTTLTEYNELYNDYLASVVRTFTGPSGETLTGMIWELSPAKRVISSKFEYDLVLMEV